MGLRAARMDFERLYFVNGNILVRVEKMAVWGKYQAAFIMLKLASISFSIIVW